MLLPVVDVAAVRRTAGRLAKRHRGALAGMTVLLTLVAAFLTSPLLALTRFTGVPLLVLGTRWSLARTG